MTEIKHFIQDKKPQVLGIIESELFKTTSTANRAAKYTTEDVIDKLSIEGYKLILPASWEQHGIEQIIMYVSEDLKYKTKPPVAGSEDLPTITVEIGIGRETKTTIHLFYRE